jgi:hypothetical protein
MAPIIDSYMGECISLIIDQGQPGVMLVQGHKRSRDIGTLTATAVVHSLISDTDLQHKAKIYLFTK